jgi:hypothetical protein
MPFRDAIPPAACNITSLWVNTMATVDVRSKRFAAGRVFRGTQVIFGERKHLQEVLDSIQTAELPREHKKNEARQLKSLIAVRTEELNRITPGWDRKFLAAQDPHSTSQDLLQIAAELSPHDYLMARVLTEHAEAPPELLERMASHPYSAVRRCCAGWPTKRTSRCGSWWPAILPRPPTCASACARECGDRRRNREARKNLCQLYQGCH